MLGASSKATGSDLNIKAVTDDSQESLIPHAGILARFVYALVNREPNLSDVRDELVREVGERGMIEAAGTAANFQRMGRVAEAIGIPLDEASVTIANSLIADLGLQHFMSAQNTYR